MAPETTSKDTTSNLFNRYVWLVDTIFRAGKITFEEINELWRRSSLNETGEELPLRTFHNHRKAIEQMFDINIECDKRGGYAYYVENSDAAGRTGVCSWLLNTFAVNNLLSENRKLKRRILFEQIPSGQSFLSPIIEAMRDDRAVEITYHAFWRDEPNTFGVLPYCVKLFKQRWYLVAFNEQYGQIRIYSLDRIKSMRITGRKFSMPADFDPEGFFSPCFGIIHADEMPPETVEIKTATRYNKHKYFRALPLHYSQQEIETTPDYSVFSYFVRPTFDLMQELLSHGDEIEVLKPASLCREMAEVAFSMAKTYGNR